VVIARGTCAGLLVVVAMLVIWSVLPTLFGWRAQVVLTGSMRPRIEPGDLVLAAPVRTGDLQPGRIVLFSDPAHAGRTLVHRLVRFDGDGNMITKGDANRSEDSTPATTTAALGIPRLRVPYVGRPVVWLHEHDIRSLLIAGAVLTGLAATVVSSAPFRPGEPIVRHPVDRV
jgi:signal peptidase